MMLFGDGKAMMTDLNNSIKEHNIIEHLTGF